MLAAASMSDLTLDLAADTVLVLTIDTCSYCAPPVKSHLRLEGAGPFSAGGLFSAVKAPFASGGVPECATVAVTASATSPRPGRMPARRQAAAVSGGQASRHG